MTYSYLLKSKKDGSFYTGISNDPWNRVKAHNRGVLETTRLKRPWDLVHTKAHDTYSEARKREVWLKKKSRSYKEHLAQLAPPEIGGVK